jgi:hypothetical protein
MRFELEQTSNGTTGTRNASALLITDWAYRVMDLWEESRAPQPLGADATQELSDACRVRDDLNNRLERSYEDSEPCAERSLQTLRNADALFRQFTVESNTAQTLSSHNHYARRGQWWWSRLPRQRFATAAA